MCDAMVFVMHEIPQKIRYLIGGHLNELSESEMTSLRLYARAHLNTHEFVNNIPVPTEQKKYNLDYVTEELQSGVKDKVDWNFTHEDMEFSNNIFSITI